MESPQGNETEEEKPEELNSGRKLLSIEDSLDTFNPLQSKLIRVPSFKATILDGAGTG